MAIRDTLRLLLIGLAVGAAAPSPAPRMTDGTGAVAALPKPAIVLLWAAWCAPCRAEVRDFATLEKAAGKTPLIVVSIEGGSRAQSLLSNVPPTRQRFPADAKADILAAYPETRGALPFAMAISKDGRTCVSHAGAVDAATIAQWRDRCGQLACAGSAPGC